MTCALLLHQADKYDPTPETLPDVVGVDVGVRYLAVTATTANKSSFYSGKRVRARADHYARLRKRLQKKGTRSATLSGRERRLKLQTNHRIAKSIVNAHPSTLIGLEDLTGIRERTKRRTRRRKKNGKGTEPVSPKARKANRHASTWAFAELHSILAYKALLSGSLTIKVDANYTSQACPLCGYTNKRNRPGNGLLFCCQNKQCPHREHTGQPYSLHADLVGARNIALRTLLVRQDWARTGVLSERPDVSNEEAKAARLARYAELRWSSDTKPSPQL